MLRFLIGTIVFPFSLMPQAKADVREDMKRADTFGKEAQALVVRNDVRTYWSANIPLLIYRVNTASDEHQFFIVDLKSGAKEIAFDHAAFAVALGKAAGQPCHEKRLPIESLQFAPDPQTLQFRAFGRSWKFSRSNHEVTLSDLPPESIVLTAPEEVMRGTHRKGSATELTIENATGAGIEMFWVDDSGERKSYGKLAAGAMAVQPTYAGHAWLILDDNGQPLAGIFAPERPGFARISGRVSMKDHPQSDRSPDGKWRAFTDGGNLFIEPVAGGERVALSHDGSMADGFGGQPHWSPDSSKLVVYREKRIEARKIHIVQSSPPDQIEPNLKTIDYPKAGDPIAQPSPHLFDVTGRHEIPIESALFNNPWGISDLDWSKDSSEFSFIYNQRGHQVMRMVGVRADNGATRTIFEDKSDTFIDYSQKYFLHRLPASGELLWASERDGWNHIYLLDELTGAVKCQITKGSWNVREVVDVDEEHRQLLLKVMGVTGQDPYHAHFIRVNFDGTGFTRLTTSDGTHRIEFSPDRNYLTDTWSRVDQPPVVELRNATDGTLICEMERADDSALQQTGWSRPERFVAKGRDGGTDIYGVIIRPVHFDPSAKLPVVENIYAGPHGFFTPKAYSPWTGMNAMAELGFVLVQLDGMGTNWRGKVFHDVCWKNLADAGFPDRIPWIKAAAATRPWMDITRVGIYGGSAGGQNTLAGLLHHGEFYKAGVADCGCHDNRMDKIWWNEAWLGWPVDDSYSKNSNVTHAAKLTGKLLLIVGELDTNVDPASTAQVVNALEKADKDFEFLPIMNSNHGAAESSYGKYRRAEFLTRHLSAN